MHTYEKAVGGGSQGAAGLLLGRLPGRELLSPHSSVARAAGDTHAPPSQLAPSSIAAAAAAAVAGRPWSCCVSASKAAAARGVTVLPLSALLGLLSRLRRLPTAPLLSAPPSNALAAAAPQDTPIGGAVAAAAAAAAATAAAAPATPLLPTAKAADAATGRRWSWPLLDGSGAPSPSCSRVLPRPPGSSGLLPPTPLPPLPVASMTPRPPEPPRADSRPLCR
jgi:hypothetical protein